LREFHCGGSLSGERSPVSKGRVGLDSCDREFGQPAARAQRQSARPVGETLIAGDVIMLALTISSRLTTALLVSLVGARVRGRRKRRRNRGGLEMPAADNRRLCGGCALSRGLRRDVFRGFTGKRCARRAQRQGAGGDLEELLGNDDIRLALDLTMTRFLLSRRVGSPSGECGPASQVQAGLVSRDCERRQAGGSTQRQSARPVGELLIAEHVIMLALAILSPLTMAPFLCLAGDRGQDWWKRRRDMACLEMLVAGGRRLGGGGALSKALRRVVFLEFGGECCAGGAQRQRAGGDLEELVGNDDI
jgi:hypothetical protein